MAHSGFVFCHCSSTVSTVHHKLKHNKTKTAKTTANQQMDKDFTFPGINFKGNSNVLLSLPQTMAIQNPKCQFAKVSVNFENKRKHDESVDFPVFMKLSVFEIVLQLKRFKV